MNISNEGLAVIKAAEGLRLRAYKCPKGKWTIGYGHTRGVRKGMSITPEIAEQLLIEDVKGAEAAVLKAINRSYDGVMALYGEIPAALVLSSLMLVDLNYKHRGPVEQTGLNLVPYGFDLLLKPYMRLTAGEDGG